MGAKKKSKIGLFEVASYLKEREINLTVRTDILSKEKVLILLQKSVYQKNYMVELPVIEEEGESLEKLVMACADNFMEEITKAESGAKEKNE